MVRDQSWSSSGDIFYIALGTSSAPVLSSVLPRTIRGVILFLLDRHDLLGGTCQTHTECTVRFLRATRDGDWLSTAACSCVGAVCLCMAWVSVAHFHGTVAQSGERLVCTQEVVRSIRVGSTYGESARAELTLARSARWARSPYSPPRHNMRDRPPSRGNRASRIG